MKWSMPLVSGSMGIRAASDQVSPSADWLKTMSLAEHLARNRQSSQATNTVPFASITALGSGLLRRPPATWWNLMLDTETPLVQDWPPSVEAKASILPFRLSNGTIPVPFGWATGCPPSPWWCPAVGIGTLQVAAPSLEVLIGSRSPAA